MGIEKRVNRLTRWFTYLFSEGENLKGILQRILNSLYRAEHREEDYSTCYGELVRRFEAFLKKLYAVCRCRSVRMVPNSRFGQYHSISVFLDKRPTRGWSWGRESNATKQPLFCAVVLNSHSLPLRQVAQVVPWFGVLVRCAILRFATMLGKTPRAP